MKTQKTTEQNTPTKKNKPEREPFDPSVAFMCFGDYVEALRGIAAQYGVERAFSAFLVLADYCLYGKEPDPENNPWGWAWAMVERKARNSINNRRRGFGAKDADKTELIKSYAAAHPEETKRGIARAVGCSDWKVRQALMECESTLDPPLESTRESTRESTLESTLDRNRSTTHPPGDYRPLSLPRGEKEAPPSAPRSAPRTTAEKEAQL